MDTRCPSFSITVNHGWLITQEELAARSGTSKHYISRLENNKSDIELLTLKKIVEAGLGRQLQVQIL